MQRNTSLEISLVLRRKVALGIEATETYRRHGELKNSKTGDPYSTLYSPAYLPLPPLNSRRDTAHAKSADIGNTIASSIAIKLSHCPLQHLPNRPRTQPACFPIRWRPRPFFLSAVMVVPMSKSTISTGLPPPRLTLRDRLPHSCVNSFLDDGVL
jgi:hypothetical protein